MPLLIECPCGKKLKVRDEHAGKKVKCPTCGKTLVAPVREGAVEEPIDVLEMIQEDEPAASPISPSQPSAVSSSTGVQRPAAAWKWIMSIESNRRLRAFTTHLTPISATFFPLGCIGLDLAVTLALAYAAYFLKDEPGWEGRGRGAIAAMVLNLLGWMGPLWTGVVGLIVAAGLGVWLLVRIVLPPIEMSIHPRPAE